MEKKTECTDEEFFAEYDRNRIVDAIREDCNKRIKQAHMDYLLSYHHKNDVMKRVEEIRRLKRLHNKASSIKKFNIEFGSTDGLKWGIV